MYWISSLWVYVHLCSHTYKCVLLDCLMAWYIDGLTQPIDWLTDWLMWCDVTCWRFINGRRRILQPMLDTSGAAAVDSKPKVNKGSTKSAQRFWPENIASLRVPPSMSNADDSESHLSDEVCQSENLMLSVCVASIGYHTVAVRQIQYVRCKI